MSDGENGPESWYPFGVTWSPDGTTLLYTAWSNLSGSAMGGTGLGVITVPADTPTDVTVLTKGIGFGGQLYGSRWAPTQTWGRQPG